jgi:hypothetical protein
LAYQPHFINISDVGVELDVMCCHFLAQNGIGIEVPKRPSRQCQFSALAHNDTPLPGLAVFPPQLNADFPINRASNKDRQSRATR